MNDRKNQINIPITRNNYNDLHIAIDKGNISTIIAIKNQHCDPNHQTSVFNPYGFNETALHMAVRKGNIQVVQELLKFEGIDVNAIDGSKRQGTALIIAIDPLPFSPLTDEKIVGILIEHIGIDLDKPEGGELHWPPLLYATHKGNKGIVEKLLTRGANPNARDIDARTSLMWATSKRDHELINLLVQWGAKDIIEGKSQAASRAITASTTLKSSNIKNNISNISGIPPVTTTNTIPHNNVSPETASTTQDLLKNPMVVAIGIVGLMVTIIMLLPKCLGGHVIRRTGRDIRNGAHSVSNFFRRRNQEINETHANREAGTRMLFVELLELECYPKSNLNHIRSFGS